jgi:Fic family protein
LFICIVIFATPELPSNFADVLERIEGVRNQLRFALADSLNRWTGFLARMSYARVIHSSNTMEGIDATLNDAVAVIDREAPGDPEDEDWLALVGHRDAMDYIIQLSKEPAFVHNEGTLLGLHFMMMKHDLSKFPGRYRNGPVHVTSMPSGRVVYEGPESSQVPTLMGDLIASLNSKDNSHPIIRAAMAHLNLTMIHPFKDGNGRMARALQTFVLARDGILDPRFSSIEEYVGTNSDEYYSVLADVGQGAWHPERSAMPWIQFCLKAHYFQAQTLVQRVEQTTAIWEQLDREVTAKGLPDRVVSALMDAIYTGRVRSTGYRKFANISAQVANRDLKQLTAAKYLISKGERRGRYYEPSKYLIDLRASVRVKQAIVDPFSTMQPAGTPRT